VSHTPPDAGAFSGESDDTTGASNVIAFSKVPISAPMVRVASILCEIARMTVELCWILTLVADVHDLEEVETDVNSDVTVKSIEAKLIPRMVRESPPDGAKLTT
jgi:hypothetical protein